MSVYKIPSTVLASGRQVKYSIRDEEKKEQGRCGGFWMKRREESGAQVY